MKFRSEEIDIPTGNIYQHDALDRKPLIEFIENFLTKVDGPFVLALDSPWGTGKTTAVRMLKAALSARSVPTIYFNAWKVDYASDPLVALVSALDSIEPKNAEADHRFKKRMVSVRKLTTSVAKHGAVAAIKAATFGALDIDSAVEKVASDMAGDLTKDLIESFHKETASLDHLRTELEKAIGELSEDAGKKPLVFFIDELDRCRPSFSIETLERIKHLFDVENLIFVLSIDKKQLEAATAAVYGDRINASEYLRRFFDLELKLPQPDPKLFTAALTKRLGLDDYFSERTAPEARDDKDKLVNSLGELAKLFRLPLRTLERAMTRVALVASQTPTNHYFDSVLVAFLVFVRATNSDLFEELLSGKSGYDAATQYVQSMTGGSEFVKCHTWLVIECYLLAGDQNEERVAARDVEIAELAKRTTGGSDVEVARKLQQLRKLVPENSFNRYGFNIATVARKVDLASKLS